MITIFPKRDSDGDGERLLGRVILGKNKQGSHLDRM